MKQLQLSLKFLWVLNKKLFLFAMVLPVVTTALIVTILYMKFYPYHAIEIKDTKILSTKVRAGDNLIYQVSYCKFDDLPAKVARTLISASLSKNGTENFIPLPLVQTITHQGCATATIQVEVPQGAEPDTYYMKANIEFNPNPMRKINVSFTTGTFEIYQ